MGSSSGFFNSSQGAQFGAMGALGAGLGQLLGNQQSAAGAAMPYLNQMGSTLSPYYQPYINAGNQALGGMQGQASQLTGMLPGLQSQYAGTNQMGQGAMSAYTNMMNNPGQTVNNIGASYHQSPGYQFALQQAMGAGNNQAAAGGMIGTPAAQQQQMQTASGLANQDYYNWFGNAMNMYGQGAQGASNLYGQGLQGQQGLYGQGLNTLGSLGQMGYGASSGLAQNLGIALNNQAGLAYAGQNAQNQAQGQGWGSMLGGAASMASFI